MERLERGDLRFFFRPTVQAAQADHVALGVQSLFAILSAEHGLHRRLRIGKKRMPSLPRAASGRGSSGSARSSAIEPYGFEDAPDEIELAARGDHLLLFEAPASSRAIWKPRADITELDLERCQLVICGACRTSETDRALQCSA